MPLFLYTLQWCATEVGWADGETSWCIMIKNMPTLGSSVRHSDFYHHLNENDISFYYICVMETIIAPRIINASPHASMLGRHHLNSLILHCWNSIVNPVNRAHSRLVVYRFLSSFCIVLVWFFLSTVSLMQVMPALNSWSSCLCLSCAGWRIV